MRKAGKKDSPVTGVAGQGMAGICQLSSDLVGAAGQQANLEQGQGLSLGQSTVQGGSLLELSLGGHPPGETACLGKAPRGEGQIGFLHLIPLKESTQ